MQAGVIVSGEDRWSDTCWTYVYLTDCFELATMMFKSRHPSAIAINVDYTHCAIGYPEPTEYI